MALLELERRDERASFEAQSAESARLNAELADARHRLETALESRSAESTRLNAELADARHRLAAVLESHSSESARLNAELADARHRLETALESRSAEAAHLNAELADASHRITELERALEAEARQLELNRRQGNARRMRMEDLEAELDSRGAEVARLNTELTDARHRILDLSSALADELMQLQSVKMSTCWKLTLPLRWFAEKFPWSARQLRRVTHARPLVSNARLLTSSKLFDRDWYLGQYPDVRIADMDPVLHYLEYGASEGRNPSALFDTNWYLQQNPDIRQALTRSFII